MSENEKGNLKFIPDKEINIYKEKKDLLGTQPYVETLLEMVKYCNTPFTIGLLGGWGVGKSSIIKTIQEELNNDKNSGIEVFKYDAWKYANDSFRRTFLLKFLEHFGLNNEDIKSRFYLSKMNGVSWGVSKIFTFQKFSSVNSNKIMEPEIFEGIFNESIQQIFRNKKFSWRYFKEFIGFSKKIEKIVIVIDNIDRCHKDLAFELLLTIKNFLEKKNVVFIIPIDDVAVKKYLIDQGYDANEFLRKLFNTTIKIKKISEGDLFGFAEYLNKEYNLGFSSDVISIVANEFSKNPRKIIQFFNILKTELLLAKKMEELGMIPEKTITNNLPFYTKLLIIREEWPDLYLEYKSNPYILKDKYIDSKSIGKIELTEEQKIFLRRTSHIMPDTSRYELFFNNRDNFKDVPDITYKYVISGDLKNIKMQLSNKELEFDKLIIFIDDRFNRSYERKEITTTVANIVSLILKMCLDDDLKEQTLTFLRNNGKFLGGVRSFIESDEMEKVIDHIDENILLNFVKQYDNLSKNILKLIIIKINRNNKDKNLILNYIMLFRDDPQKLRPVSRTFSYFLKSSPEFFDKCKDLLEKDIIIEQMIEPEVIDYFIETISISIDDQENVRRLKVISLYHSIKKLTKEQTKKLMTKFVSFAGKGDDLRAMSFWLEKVAEYIKDVEEEDYNGIYNLINQRHNWLWQRQSWNGVEYIKAVKILLRNIIELYYLIMGKDSRKGQLLSLLNLYFQQNKPKEIILFINELFCEKINGSYDWPFLHIVIEKFNLFNGEEKRIIANTLNLMLHKTTGLKGLKENQIKQIYKYYINLLDTSEFGNDSKKWILESLKNNSALIEYFKNTIKEIPENNKFKVIDILQEIKEDDFVEEIITERLKGFDCGNLGNIFNYLEEKKISKKIIKKSIKSILSTLNGYEPQFGCFVNIIIEHNLTNKQVNEIIRQKVKVLLNDPKKEKRIFALKVILKLDISDKEKMEPLMILINDMNTEDFSEEEIKLLNKVKTKMQGEDYD